MVACTPLTYSVQFVTCIPVTGAPATGTMSLTDTKWCTTNQTRFPPPPVKRAISETLLMHGASYPADAYADRILELRLVVEGTDADDLATEIQRLMRQLAAERNTLEVKMSTTQAVYFRTYKVTPEDISIVLREQRIAAIAVDVLAEPFAYGPEEIVGSRFVSYDPAATGNGTSVGSPAGMFMDVSGVKGDVEAYTKIISDELSTGRTYGFSTRRRGNPADAQILLQAEAMTQFIDTTTQPNDATMSGSGNNFSRTTFATFTGLDDRLGTLQFPVSTTGDVDHRGRYRVYSRHRANGSGTFQFVLRQGGIDESAPSISNKMATKTTVGTETFMVDLGEVQVPLGLDVRYDGPSGCELRAGGHQFVLQIGRTSGSTTIDTDYLLFIPADERFASVKLGNDVIPTEMVLDSYAGTAYPATFGSVQGQLDYVTLGALPQLLPSPASNRIYVLEIIGTNQVNIVDEFVVSYWPAYLEVRPVST